jgi:hypothetical protein
MKFKTRKEIKKRKEFAQATTALIFAKNAKPFTPTQPVKKDPVEKLKEDVAIIKSLARLSVAKQPENPSREVLIEGDANTGKAITACAALLKIAADAEHAGSKIKLINHASGEFTKAAATAIIDTVKSLGSPVEIVTPKPIISASNKAPSN